MVATTNSKNSDVNLFPFQERSAFSDPEDSLGFSLVDEEQEERVEGLADDEDDASGLVVDPVLKELRYDSADTFRAEVSFDILKTEIFFFL